MNLCLRHRKADHHGELDKASWWETMMLGAHAHSETTSSKSSNALRETGQHNLNDIMVCRSLAAKMDLDVLNKYFAKIAGGDASMDANEFGTFAKEVQLPAEDKTKLWNFLDADEDGEVTMDEFKSALTKLQTARAWSRYCPDCCYSNTCAYCDECNLVCPLCNEHRYCASHWQAHPGRLRTTGVDEQREQLASLDLATQARMLLLVKPLTFLYRSPKLAWLPVRQKALLRNAIAVQQQAIDDALYLGDEDVVDPEADGGGDEVDVAALQRRLDALEAADEVNVKL